MRSSICVNGRYQLLARIGEGSSSVVYGARDLLLHRFVAVKLLREDAVLTSERKDGLLRETRALLELDNPSIATTFEIGESLEGFYLAMEILNGADLHRHIQNKTHFELADKLEFFAKIFDGLDYAHKRNFVHGKIKPSKIFLDQDCSPKLLDFAAARWNGSITGRSANLDREYGYVSPEELLGGPVDSRSDLFSAAVVFFEFLVYKHPFDANFIPRQIVEAPPGRLSLHNSEIPIRLEELIHRALAKRKEDRIQTAAEFAGEIRSIRSGLRGRPLVSVGDASRDAEAHTNVEAAKIAIAPEENEQSPAPAASGARTQFEELPRESGQTIEAAAATPGRNLQPFPILKAPVRFALGAAAVIAFVLAGALARLHQPAMRGVARAVVEQRHTGLFEGPSNSSKLIRVLGPGASINVLESIRSPSQGWVLAQYVSPDGSASKPGYVPVSTLGQWSTDDPEFAWKLAMLERPADQDDAQLSSFELRIRTLKNRFAALRARCDLELARIYLENARRKNEKGESPDDAAAALRNAANALSDLPPGLSRTEVTDRDALNVDLTNLRVSSPSPSAPASTPQPEDERLKELIRRVRALYEDGKYDKGLSLIGQILTADPTNAEALKERQRFQSAIQFEKQFETDSP